MQTPSASTLIGSRESPHNVYALATALLLFGITFVFYSVPGVSPGVLPAVAAGATVAIAIGFFRAGLVAAWLATYTSLLGYTAVDVFSTSGPLLEQLGALVGPQTLSTAGVESIVIGSGAFLLGYGLSWGLDSRSEDDDAASGPR